MLYLWGHVDPLAVHLLWVIVGALSYFAVKALIRVAVHEYRIYKRATQYGGMIDLTGVAPERDPYDKEALDRLWWSILRAGDHPFEEEEGK